MRTCLTIALTLVAACGGYNGTGVAARYVESHHLDEVRVDEDEFQGTTTVIATPILENTGDGVIVRYMTLIGEPGEEVALMSIHAEIRDGWKYLDCHTLAFSIDGEPTPLDADHDGEVMGTYAGKVKTRESVKAPVGIDVIRRLAASENARGRVCNDEFPVNARTRELLAEFLAKVADDA